jgi:hypothetical protein
MMKYKLIVGLIFLLPISSFLVYSAITGQTYDAEIHTKNNAIVEVLPYDDNYIVFSDEASYSGYLVPYNESYALYITKDDIVKVGRAYFMVYQGAWTNFDDVPPPETTTSKWVVSITTIIGLMIVLMIIGGKMDVLKSHPRASVMVSLVIGTAILWGVSSIVTDLLNVFLVATGTWVAYLIAYGVHQGKITRKQADMLESKLLNELRGKLNGNN